MSEQRSSTAGSSVTAQLSDIKADGSHTKGTTLPSFEESDFYLNIDDVQLGALIGQGEQ